MLAAYTAANNNANTQRSDTLLATIETGSSYAIDAALYQAQQAAGTAPYPAFSAVQATYYIPRAEPAGRAALVRRPGRQRVLREPERRSPPTSTCCSPSPPRPSLAECDRALPAARRERPADHGRRRRPGHRGQPWARASVKVAPGQLPAVTAASLDGTGRRAIANPGNLADRADQQLWQAKVPGGTVTDTHTAAAGTNAQEYALLTTDGGALVFYTDAAELTITPPAGSTLHLTVPGFYTPAQALTRATVSYLDQFAAYDPPAAAGTPRIVADYSAITGKRLAAAGRDGASRDGRVNSPPR